MTDGPLIMTDVFTYISPLCLIALFFFCFCRFLARPCISTHHAHSNGELITQTVIVRQRNGRRRERNPRQRRSRSIATNARVQPTAQLPPIHLLSEPGGFPEIIFIRSRDEPPKYEDAIKLEDPAPPAYTPRAHQEDATFDRLRHFIRQGTLKSLTGCIMSALYKPREV
uniref:Uncharacterized protein n=1 Tax=Parascaris univalens TaxID=6257 RepID=A0A915C4T3_PARUN